MLFVSKSVYLSSSTYLNIHFSSPTPSIAANALIEDCGMASPNAPVKKVIYPQDPPARPVAATVLAVFPAETCRFDSEDFDVWNRDNELAIPVTYFGHLPSDLVL